MAQNKFPQLHIVSHPLIQDSLGHLRNKETDIQKYRHHSDKICQLLFVEALKNLDSSSAAVETPLTTTTFDKLADEVIVVPVLRAGLAMLFGAMHVLPKSKIGFVGLARDEKTAIAKQYYWKLPNITHQSVVIVTDPMLATGGSLSHLIKEVAPTKPKSIIVVCVIAAPEGVERITSEFPNVEVYTAALDEKLNDQKYIVPGLGDYGDRYFGTN